MFDISSHNLRVIAEECERQMVGPTKVLYMARAWNTCHMFQDVLNLNIIRSMGYCVEPHLNDTKHWRRCELYIAGLGPQPIKANKVEHSMQTWWHLSANMTPAEFYREFEVIHPLKDGNGRIGMLLYNWKIGKLHEMVPAPDVF